MISMKCRRCGTVARYLDKENIPKGCDTCCLAAIDQCSDKWTREDIASYANQYASGFWMTEQESNEIDAAKAAKTKGGKRPGSGRKALDLDGTIVTTVRLTAKQKATLDMLGGAQWLRQHLDTFA